MTDLLGLGLSGLRAYKTALSVVGDNVANAETPGYSRRTVGLTPASTITGAPGYVYIPRNEFEGVEVQSIQRSWDAFKAAEMRRAESDAGQADVKQRWLGAVEVALNDSETGVGQKLTGFFNAADALASTPDDNLRRRQVLMALEDVATAFTGTVDSLNRISEGLGTAANVEVTDLNTKLQALDKNNRMINMPGIGSTARAALEDERDQLINDISSKLGVVATLNTDGTTKLTLAGSPTTTVLDRGNVGSVAVAQAADGRLSMTLTNNSGTAAMVPTSGKLAGLVGSADATASRRTEVTNLAAAFATDLNTWSAAGRDASGNPGVPLVAASATGLTLLVTDPALVPAATPAGASNGNLLALQALRGPTGTERTWTELVARNAQDVSATKAQYTAAVSLRDNAKASLDEITGIDLDKEAADMLRFQQAYTASAKIVQAGKETVDTVLGLF